MINGILTKACASASRGAAWRFRHKVAAAVVLLALAGGSASGFAAEPAGSAGATIENLYASLLATMRNGSVLGASGRYAQLAPVIRQSFDLPYMARLAFGFGWSRLTPMQQQQVTESYGRYMSAVYAERFDSYHGQRLNVTGARQDAPLGLIVTSKIIKSDGDPVEVDYLMRQNGGRWAIGDIYLDGTISEVATHRSEFAAILKRQDFDGLIAALDRKAEMLTGTAARAD
ncbi:MAG: ABC transporter substrate-binding protein [Alphaproteobacteria bacterium]|nr:ABC transporter substrate-binding protein [Alphaproteobacteria bacterium]